MEHRAKFLGVALLCVAFGSEALTLGRTRGATLLGQPLNMVVQAQLNTDEDASSLCLTAEVFHADTRQDASRVRVVVEPTAQANVANVRVLSSTLIDEPVVTVYLHTGCGQKTTRRYVLLADLASEAVAPSMPIVAPASALPLVPLDVTPTTPTSTVKAKTARVPKQTITQQVANKRPDMTPALATPQDARLEKNSKAGRSTGKARLKLDTLEFFSDRIANLDSPMTFAPPEDAVRNMQKIQTLEGDVKALLASATRNEADLVDLKARLQKAESERFSSGLIYGLITLVLLSLAAVAFLWRRQRRVQASDNDWWSTSIATPTPIPPAPNPEPEPASEPTAAHKEPDERFDSKKTDIASLPELSNDFPPSSEVDVNLVEMSDSRFLDFMQPDAQGSANSMRPQSPSPLVTPQTRLARSLHSEAILDIRQQAEFFVSLGQTDRAVQILKRQIDESQEPNPFVFLDLLSIYQSLSLKTDFQQLRENFNQLFNGRAPELSLFKNEGRDLASYPDVLSVITASWTTSQALTVLDAFIFLDSLAATPQSFDLAAFRDLLLLHAIAQSADLASHAKADDSQVGATASIATPAPSRLSARSIPAQPDLAQDQDQVPLPRVLDLDLSDAETGAVGSRFVSAPGADSPPTMSGHHVAGVNPRPAHDSGNLMDFDLPEAPKRAGPTDNR